MVRFDAYVATSRAVSSRVILDTLLSTRADTDQVRQSRGYHRFAEKVALLDDSGSEVLSVLFGGQAHGDRVMVEAKGARTPDLVAGYRALVPDHRVTRSDSCLDVDRPGAWDELHSTFQRIKAKHGLIGARGGDWEDFPEKGRSEYLGSESAVTRAIHYEKGKQPEYAHLERWDWNRVEVRVKPKTPAAGKVYSELTALQVWGASPWTRELAGELLEADLEPFPAGTVKRQSKRDSALRFMCGQYGAHLLSLKAELGSWDVLGLTLGEMISEEQDRARRWKQH